MNLAACSNEEQDLIYEIIAAFAFTNHTQYQEPRSKSYCPFCHGQYVMGLPDSIAHEPMCLTVQAMELVKRVDGTVEQPQDSISVYDPASKTMVQATLGPDGLSVIAQ
jgi:hypothetical protein